MGEKKKRIQKHLQPFQSEMFLVYQAVMLCFLAIPLLHLLIILCFWLSGLKSHHQIRFIGLQNTNIKTQLSELACNLFVFSRIPLHFYFSVSMYEGTEWKLGVIGMTELIQVLERDSMRIRNLNRFYGLNLCEIQTKGLIDVGQTLSKLRQKTSK